LCVGTTEKNVSLLEMATKKKSSKKGLASASKKTKSKVARKGGKS